jgi:hypothetical protein
VDPATLAKMFPAQHEEDDEIWNSDKPNHPKGKFNQTQTIFGDDVSISVFLHLITYLVLFNLSNSGRA